MTVAELIEALQAQPQDATVKVALPSALEAVNDITGLTAMSSAQVTPGGHGPVEVAVYLQGPDVITMYDGEDGDELHARYGGGG